MTAMATIVAAINNLRRVGRHRKGRSFDVVKNPEAALALEERLHDASSTYSIIKDRISSAFVAGARRMVFCANMTNDRRSVTVKDRFSIAFSSFSYRNRPSSL